MANANRGLGRGLGALLGDAALQTESADSLYLPISQVESCAGQPRKHFDDAALADLADSIREHGIIQPLTCLLYTSPSPRDVEESRMPSSA